MVLEFKDTCYPQNNSTVECIVMLKIFFMVHRKIRYTTAKKPIVNNNSHDYNNGL